ncbi:MAG: PAS domain S-box protein [Deltaproteobacteria bacterium]|nr:PAS domain S-box protein [Deltaproteobacteria bacterium]
MNEQSRTNAELIKEISGLKQRIQELEQSESDRKQAEESLRESRELYRTFINATSDMVYLKDEQFRNIVVNKSMAAFFGKPEGELISKSDFELMPQIAAEKCRQTDLEALSNQSTFISEEIIGDQWYETLKFPVELRHNRVGVGGFIRDITDRKQAEAALQESEGRYRTVADFTYAWEYWLAPDGKYIYVSPACERISEYRVEEFHQDPKLLESITHPDDKHRLAVHIHDVLRGKSDACKMEFRIITKNNEERWIGHDCQRVYGRDGKYLGQRGSNRDITDRKQAEAEIRQLNDELEQRVIERTAQLEIANKELEAFTYSVSHDLKAPLRAVDGYAQILIEDHAVRLDSEGRRTCEIISNNARKMGKLIDDLLAFSRTSRIEMNPAPVDMATLANSIFFELTTPEERERIDFHVAPLPQASGDPPLIRQVWTNLLVNAVKFSAKKERAVIEVGCVSEGSGHPVSSEIIKGKLAVVYFVQDNGAGFDMAYADKLFGVFQRLHSEKEFEGTGVGLAIVQQIVQRHGGRIWAEGEVGKGATFYFTLGKEL